MPRRSIEIDSFQHANPIPAASRVGPLLASSIIAPRDPGRRASVPEDVDGQLANLFHHVGEMLDAAGADWRHIAKMTFYVRRHRRARRHQRAVDRALPRPGLPSGPPHPGLARPPVGPSPATSWPTSMTEIRSLKTAVARRRHRPRRAGSRCGSRSWPRRPASSGFDYVVRRHAARAVRLQQTRHRCCTPWPALPTVPIVRVPWNEQGIIGRVLDAGAMGVIIPMVNSPEEARRGRGGVPLRAEGRARASGRSSPASATAAATTAVADDAVACIPMIETRQAVEAIDDILAVDGHRRRLHRPRRPVDHLRPAAGRRQPRRPLRRCARHGGGGVPAPRRGAGHPLHRRRWRPSASGRLPHDHRRQRRRRRHGRRCADATDAARITAVTDSVRSVRSRSIPRQSGGVRTQRRSIQRRAASRCSCGVVKPRAGRHHPQVGRPEGPVRRRPARPTARDRRRP